LNRYQAAMLNYACKAGEAGKAWWRLYSCLYSGYSGQDEKNN